MSLFCLWGRAACRGLLPLPCAATLLFLRLLVSPVHVPPYTRGWGGAGQAQAAPQLPGQVLPLSPLLSGARFRSRLRLRRLFLLLLLLHHPHLLLRRRRRGCRRCRRS